MTDREKVIKWLECMSGHAKTCEEGCPNFIQVAPDIGYGAVGYCDKANMAKNAITLLREQEPIWKEGIPFCGECRTAMSKTQDYCHKCGRKVDWNA